MQYEYILQRKPKNNIASVRADNPELIARYAIDSNLIPPGEPKEKAYLIIVSKDLMTKGYIKISEGGFDSTTIDERFIMTSLLLSGHERAVLVHSHPNGKCNPSLSDIRSTEDLHKAMKAFGCSLLDHVIIGEDGYYSFTNEVVKKLDNHA